MSYLNLKTKRHALLGYPLALLTFVLLYRWRWRSVQDTPSTKEPDIFSQSDQTFTLSKYLDARFDCSQTIFVTLVGGNYVSASHNFENKLRELNLDHPVINICADAVCQDYTQKRQLNGYGGYIVAESINSTSTEGFESQEHMARVGKLPKIKFHALRELASSGWTSVWFEGDIYLIDDPFPHMLNNSQPWDMQFTFDGWTLVNFGWVYTRPTAGSVQFWKQLYKDHLANPQEWDQYAVHYALADAEISGDEDIGQTLTQNGLRIFVLPWRKFWGQHLTGGNRHLSASDKQVVMHHLTAVWGPLRSFVAKERGWYTDVDNYYSQASQRQIVTTPYLSGSLTEVTQAMVLLLSIGKLSGRTVLLPERIFIYGIERNMSEVFPIGALLPHIELLEGKYMKHAKRYVPDIEDLLRQTRRIPLVVHRTVNELLTAVFDRSDDQILSLEGWQLSAYTNWDVHSTFGHTAAEMFLDLPVCRSWYQDMDFKYRYYCSPNGDHFI